MNWIIKKYEEFFLPPLILFEFSNSEMYMFKAFENIEKKKTKQNKRNYQNI